MGEGVRGVEAMNGTAIDWNAARDEHRRNKVDNLVALFDREFGFLEPAEGAVVTVTRPDRHYLPEGARLLINGRYFTTRFDGSAPNVLRIMSLFEIRRQRVTRASVNKRNRHAKRPGGRRWPALPP